MFRWLKNQTTRFYLAITGISITFVGAWLIGGIILTATTLVAATYFGSMITLWRMPNEIPKDWGLFKRALIGPLIKTRNFLFDHTLAMTLALGVMTGFIVGITTVTGIVATAISALIGDMVVQAFKDGIELYGEEPVVA